MILTWYIYIYIYSKNLLVYYFKYYTTIGYATRYLFVNRYRVAANNATTPSYFGGGGIQCLFLVFRNNFEETTNTSLFLLNQLTNNQIQPKFNMLVRRLWPTLPQTYMKIDTFWDILATEKQTTDRGENIPSWRR